MAQKLITGPASEPITTAEAKAHLRVYVSDDDTYIATLVVAARQLAEQITQRALLPQTWELALDEFPYVLTLKRTPLISITSVKYVDDAGALTTMDTADYQLDDHSEPARIMPAWGLCWPSTRCQMNAVFVRYQAGYTNAAAVPQAIKNWMLLRVGTAYENRESVAAGVTLAELPHLDALLDPYRIWGK